MDIEAETETLQSQLAQPVSSESQSPQSISSKPQSSLSSVHVYFIFFINLGHL